MWKHVITIVAACLSSAGISHAQNSKTVVGIAYQGLSRPINVSAQEGARKAAAEVGIELRETDAADRNDKQLNDVQDLIAQRIKGLLVLPTDSGTGTAYVPMAQKAGIPIVGVMTPFGVPDHTNPLKTYPGLAAYVAWDDVDAGKTIGKKIGEDYAGRGRPVTIGVLEGKSGFISVELRRRGFLDALGASGTAYKIKVSQPGDWTQDKGEAVCQNMAAAFPDLDAIFSMSDEMSVGCARALESRNIKLYSVGGSVKGIELLGKGKIVATACIKPSMVGYQAVKMMRRVIDGDREVMGKTILLPTPLVTIKNISDCVPEW